MAIYGEMQDTYPWIIPDFEWKINDVITAIDDGCHMVYPITEKRLSADYIHPHLFLFHSGKNIEV